MNDIISRIDELRVKRGMSKAVFAKEIGVTPTTICNWSRLDSLPALSVIQKVCDVTGVTVGLCRNRNEKPSNRLSTLLSKTGEESFMIDVVERINELMRIKGWTAYELSNQTGISTNAIYDWNKTGATPTMQNIIKVCEAMDITLGFFFCGGDYKYTDDEKRLLNKWVALSEEQRKVVTDLIYSFNKAKV